MRAGVLAIGTELLLGQIVDTNSSWIGEQLAAVGIDTMEHRKVGDNLGRMVGAMREMRTALTRRAANDIAPVMAVIGAGNGQDRSIAALNVALSAARDGAKVLMIDADHKTYALSNKVSLRGRSAMSVRETGCFRPVHRQ